MSEKNLKIVVVLFLIIYGITVIERYLNRNDNPTELMFEYSTEKAKLQNKINLLEEKNHGYELELLKIKVDVSNLTNEQLDSTWSAIFD